MGEHTLRLHVPPFRADFSSQIVHKVAEITCVVLRRLGVRHQIYLDDILLLSKDKMELLTDALTCFPASESGLCSQLEEIGSQPSLDNSF